MAIKNYTTTVEVHKSLGEIQGALAGHGARKIMVDYDGAGQPVGITFGIETPDGPRGFLLPANVAGVKAVFARQKVRAPGGPGGADRLAQRPGLDHGPDGDCGGGQVEIQEVFFPYLTDGRGRTVYQLYRGGQLAIGDGLER